MNLADLANLGEFVGGVVVVASVVYLALQIRQNTFAVRMAAHENVFESFRAIISPLKTDERLAELLVPGIAYWWRHQRRVLTSTTAELLDSRLREPSTLAPRLDELLPWWGSSAASGTRSRAVS